KLRAFNIGEAFSFQWSRDCFSGCLTPPAPGCPVFKHRVKVIHANEAEVFRTAIHRRFEYTTRAADVAIRYHDFFSCKRVSYLVVILDITDWVCFRNALTAYGHNNTAVIERVFGSGGECQRLRLQEHMVGSHPEIEHIDDHSYGNSWQNRDPFSLRSECR